MYAWIKRIVTSESKKPGTILINFCSDEALLNMNKKFLGHNYYTDIITFDYSENDLISGELFISVDRAKDNAISYGVALNQEINRLMAHGVLHLCGFMDKSGPQREAMTLKENEKLGMLND